MEERKHVVEHQESTRSNGPRTLIGIIFGILEFIFVVRFILKLLGADATNSLVNTLYTYTDYVVNPIKGILGDISFTALSSNGVLELASLAILILLFIIGGLLMSLFKPKVIHRREYEEVEERDQPERPPVTTSQRERRQPVIERHGDERPVPVSPAQETTPETSVPQNDPVAVDDTPVNTDVHEEAPVVIDDRPVAGGVSDENLRFRPDQQPPQLQPKRDLEGQPDRPELQHEVFEHNPEPDAVREVELEDDRPHYEAGQVDPPPYHEEEPTVITDRPAEVTEPTHEVEVSESFQEVSERVPADHPDLVEDAPKREPHPEGTEEIIVDNSDPENVIIQRKNDL